MKAVLSKIVISEELGYVGIPAAFLVTALQQCTAFMLLLVITIVSACTPVPYKPRILTTKKDFIAVCCFALAFAFNISLNNFSLALLPLSLNLIIRSCLPLSTALSQNVLCRFTGQRAKDVKPIEFLVMFIGVF